MALNDLSVKKEYRNLSCDIVHDFYIPVISEAISYKRAVGFFSSAALYEIAVGIKNLVQNGGKIQLIASPHLSEEDIEAIRLGYEKRDEIIARAILKEIKEPANHAEEVKLNLLADLIAEGILDIKIAFKIQTDAIGIFHEKIGVVRDAGGNILAFTGSMNETYSGLLLNYESIDVYCSWKDEDKERAVLKEAAFDDLWNNMDSNIAVIPFPEVAIERFNCYKKLDKNSIFNDVELEEMTMQSAHEDADFFIVPSDVKFYDYQIEAIDAWLAHDGRGIFDMATGTGKTYTALGSLSELSRKCHKNLGVFIVCPYQHLVQQWVADIEAFNVHPLICYSKYDWKRRFKDIVRDFMLGIIENFCIITTNATFALKEMQEGVGKLRGNICLVVDEAHNFGSKRQLACMSEIFRFRLALSATLERKYDEYGTERLFSYFGEKCIEYSLKRAIDEDKLTPYYYYPIPVYFTDEELLKYVNITEKIVNILRHSKKDDDLPPAAERLLIERARIVAGADGKLNALKNTILPYKNDTHLLVYCGATKVDLDNDKTDTIVADEERQIIAVTKILGNELGMCVTRFTSEEDAAQRELIKEEYSQQKIQALVAIKCLDEGMNIPGIETAFILASSTNPKEYIQRRGRVLRKAPGKKFARIYDYVVLPRPFEEISPPFSRQAELSLVKREVERMKDFQELSENPSETSELIRMLTEKYKIYEEINEYYGRI